MLKMDRTYTDFEGNERKETLYFNLTKAELTRMNLSEPGGITKKLTKIGQEMDVPAIMEIFRTLILDSYGEVSSDGRRFIKSKEMRDAFEQTNAYSDLFMELCTDANAAVDFLAGIVPKDIGEEIRKADTLQALPQP